MSCKDALISKDEIVVVSTNITVQETMNKIRESDHPFAIAVDEGGLYMGRVSARTVIKRLLPKVATLKGYLGPLDFVLGAEPGFARDLIKIKKGLVKDVIRSDVPTVELDTPAIQAMRVLVEEGSPIAVINKKTREFFGVVTEDSVLKRLRTSAQELEKQLREEKKG